MTRRSRSDSGSASPLAWEPKRLEVLVGGQVAMVWGGNQRLPSLKKLTAISLLLPQGLVSV